MKFDFQFSNLCGTSYTQGNIIFTPDGNSVLLPAGNRVTIIDLVSHVSSTLPFENRKNVSRLALSPNGNVLLSIDEDGGCLLINYARRVLLSHFHFKKRVDDIQFSHDSSMIAVTFGRHIQIWKTPKLICEFTPFTLLKTLTGHTLDIVSLEWIDNSTIISSSKDNTTRVTSLTGYNITLAGHKDTVIKAFKNEEFVYTVSKDGAVFVWKWVPFDNIEEKSEEVEHLKTGRYKIDRKFYFNQNAKVSSASWHSSLLVAGFSSGVFALYSLPEMSMISELSVGRNSIDTVTINPSGEWIAIGGNGTLVWEWKSETYVLKQQGHSMTINSVCYAPDGQLIVTGGEDGKVKIWNASNGFCFVTFSEHLSSVTGVCFASNTVVLSCSIDGTVRAYDLVRYRTFRVMSGPTPTPFTSIAVDAAGEIVCCGTDSFSICVFQLQTGKLMDVLVGHEGPVSSLSFCPGSNTVVSSSWDGTLKMWNVFEGGVESMSQGSDALAVCYRPDGKEIVSSGLNGQLYFWDSEQCALKFTIEGRKDIQYGRKLEDVRSAENNTSNCAFTSLCYSSDGTCVLAGGNSKFICIYDITSRLLMKRFLLSINQSFDGINDKLNSRLQTETGTQVDTFDLENEDEDKRESIQRFNTLPGVQKGEFSSRKTRPVVRSKCVVFSPDAHSFSVASTEGLMIYSIDHAVLFDPVDLDIEITPKTIKQTLKLRQFAKSLVMALRLSERDLIINVLENTPVSEISLVLKSVPVSFFETLLDIFSNLIEKSAKIEFYLRWTKEMFLLHGVYLQNNRNIFASVFRALQKAVAKQYNDFSKICNENQYQLDYLCAMPKEDNNMQIELNNDIDE